MKLIAGEINWKNEAMKRENRRRNVYPSPEDGREWILLEDAAQLAGLATNTLRKYARKHNWTRTARHGVKAWLLKKDFDHYLWLVKTKERWYKNRRPKHWEPMVSMERKENECKFPDYWWTAIQAAAFMGVSRQTIHKWTKQGKIPVFTTCKLGKGGKYWYSPTSLRSLKESEDWQKRRAILEKGKATMQQGIVAREVYKVRHRPRVYRGVPPGWITIREVAERLEVSLSTTRHLRKMHRFMSEQFVGKWDAKKRPWFCDEDGVERLKNDEEYQKWRRIGENAVRAIIGKPPLNADSSTGEPHQPVTFTRQHEITFGYTNEELKMPHLRVTGINDMW